MAMSTAILTKSVTSGMHEECVAGVCIASLASLFLFFIGKEWTNMVTPVEPRFKTKKYFGCKNINRAAVQSMQMENPNTWELQKNVYFININDTM